MSQQRLTLSEARTIRKEYLRARDEGGLADATQRRLAKEWGCHQRTIQRIIAGDTHKETQAN